MLIVYIDASVAWHVGHDPERGRWYGVCPDLNLNASGDTQFDMLECAGEAVQLLFEDLVEDDELDAFLEERGWTKANPKESSTPKFVDPEESSTPKFDVPFEMKLHAEAGELPLFTA